jgi:FOG: WD40 repeat
VKIRIIFIAFIIFFLTPLMNAYSDDNPIRWIRPIWTSANSVIAAAITSDNRYVAATSGAQLLFWDLSQVKIAKRFIGHAKRISQITLSADNKYAFSGDEAGVLKIWDVIAGKEIRTINAHDTPIFIINISADGRYVMTGSHDGIKKLWDFHTGKELQRVKGFKWNQPTLARLSADGKQIIGEDDNGFIVVWDALNGNIVKKIKMPDKEYTVSLISADGHYAVVERLKSTSFYPELWDIKEGKKIRIFNFKKYEKNYQSFISTLGGAFTSDNKKILSLYIDFRRYVLWDIDEDQPVIDFSDEFYEGGGSNMFSLNGKYIASGSAEDMARLWDAATGKEIVKIIGMKDGAWLIITPEGYYDASEKAVDAQMIVEYRTYLKCPLNNYRETFYHPDLVKVVLSGGSLKDYKKISEVPIPPICIEMKKREEEKKKSSCEQKN